MILIYKINQMAFGEGDVPEEIPRMFNNGLQRKSI